MNPGTPGGNQFRGEASGRPGATPTGQDVKNTVRQTGQDVADAAKQTAQAAYSTQRNRFVGEVESLASALRQTGRNMRLTDSGSMAVHVTDTIADRLETISRGMDGKNLDQIVSDVEQYARTNPAMFFGAAALAGFFAVRFLKSSGDRAMNRQMSTYNRRPYLDETGSNPFVSHGEDI